jgi:hypothetical protein
VDYSHYKIIKKRNSWPIDAAWISAIATKMRPDGGTEAELTVFPYI